MDCDWIAFLPKSILFGDIFMICCGLGITFLDIFGVFHGLWTCLASWGALGCQNQVTKTCPWSPLGSISAPFFDENRIIFHVFLLIAFLDVFFIDF